VERTPILNFQGKQAIDFQTKCNTFRSAMFRTPPEAPPAPPIPPGPTLEWPAVTSEEIARAIQTSAPNKAPGPDGMPFLLLQKAYQAVPQLFNTLYPPLIEHGYHPLCWRQATGAILKKQNKPDYTAPKAYRIIALLNCLGKISEKIIATRLSYLAETTDLLHHEQMGGRRYRAAIDAVLCLLHDITNANNRKKILSTLFFDVKGAFDHVSKSRLLDTMQRLHLHPAVIRWTDTFLSDRQIGLAFDGESEDLQPVNTGIPQGSPISPILFLIYLRFLFTTIQQRHPDTTTPSYIDDVACLVVGDSEEENCRKLEDIARTAFEWGDNNAVAFDDPKTELIHFHRQRHSPQCSVTLPNGTIIKPSPVVRWLGVFFDRKLSFKAHVDKKTASASRALQMTSRLKTSEWGLSSQHLRQLYTSCVLPILDFGAEAWWRGQKGYTNKLQKLQNTASRRILGAFRTSPVVPMELEASLPPPTIRLQQTCRKYALRTMTLPEHHPIRLRTSTTFPPEFNTGIEIDLRQNDWYTTDNRHSQLWRIHNSIADLTPSSTQLERLDHTANPPWFKSLDPKRVLINIPRQKKEEVVEAHTNLTNMLVNNPEHLLIYTDGSQTRAGSNGTGLVAIHAQHPHSEAQWNLGKHVEVYDTELFGVLQATAHARQWVDDHPNTSTIWIFVDNQAAIQRCTTPHPTPGQHLSLQIINNLQTILNARPNTKVNIQWVPGHTEVIGNEAADRCAKQAADLTPRSRQSFTSIAYVKRQIQQAGQREWQQLWNANSSGSTYCSIARGQPLWGPTWKPTKLPNTNQTTASTIHQLRLGHGYFRSYLTRLPNYDSTRCQCSEPVQTAKHLLLGCPIYREERKRAGIQRETTLQSLLFSQRGTAALIDFIQETGVATRRWLLQDTGDDEVEDSWGWGSLREVQEEDGEEEG
jgi:ribonuclease HI